MGGKKMTFVEGLKQRAKQNKKTIVLPEATDIRVLKATQKILEEDFANIILVGNNEDISKIASENEIDISKAQIVNPLTSEKYEEYINAFYELRKEKGMTQEKSKELMLDPVFFGMMMVKQEKADGLVSGAAHSTADTLRPALQ